MVAQRGGRGRPPCRDDGRRRTSRGHAHPRRRFGGRRLQRRRRPRPLPATGRSRPRLLGAGPVTRKELTPITEQNWLACADPAQMLALLGTRLHEQQARRFAVACCRRTSHLSRDHRITRLIAAADRLAHGRLSPGAYRLAVREAFDAYAESSPGDAYALSLGILPPEHASLDAAVAAALGDKPAVAYLY